MARDNNFGGASRGKAIQNFVVAATTRGLRAHWTLAPYPDSQGFNRLEQQEVAQCSTYHTFSSLPERLSCR